MKAVACQGSRVIKWLAWEAWVFIWSENVGLRVEEKKLKNERVQGAGCNMQIWDEISSDLLSITLGDTALGDEEAVAPG